MKLAMTSVYRVMAVCTPVTVVPMSFATVAIDTFITEGVEGHEELARGECEEDEAGSGCRGARDCLARRCLARHQTPLPGK